LGFQYTIGPAALLLFTELDAVLGLFAGARLSVLSRRGVALYDAAFIRVAAVAFEEELDAFPAALPAY
jgi:hypothetical protein